MGFDINHNNPVSDWGAARDGHSFVWLKATEGATFVDPAFADNWQRAHAAGFVCGAYHFHRCGASAEAQARNFLTALHSVGGLAETDLPPCLDFEDRKGIAQVGIHAAVENGVQVLRLMDKYRGRGSVVYIDRDLANAQEQGPAVNAFGAWHLWLADYSHGEGAPHVPSQFSDWAFWQFSDQGSVPGIAGTGVDVDRFRFGADGLAAWVASTVRGPAVWPLPDPLT